MTDRFTSGPWQTTRYPTEYTDIFTWSISQAGKHDGIHRYGIVFGIDDEANARLMAAAPALLAALRSVLKIHVNGVPLSEWEGARFDAARAAITKATED